MQVTKVDDWRDEIVLRALAAATRSVGLVHPRPLLHERSDTLAGPVDDAACVTDGGQSAPTWAGAGAVTAPSSRPFRADKRQRSDGEHTADDEGDGGARPLRKASSTDGHGASQGKAT